jgi:MoxR-like ATPase
MSAIDIVNATESLIHTLAMGVAAGNRTQAYVGDSPRTVAAVRQLIGALQKERAANLALQEENELLRHQLVETAAMLMRLRSELAGT